MIESAALLLAFTACWFVGSAPAASCFVAAAILSLEMRRETPRLSMALVAIAGPLAWFGMLGGARLVAGTDMASVLSTSTDSFAIALGALALGRTIAIFSSMRDWFALADRLRVPRAATFAVLSAVAGTARLGITYREKFALERSRTPDAHSLVARFQLLSDVVVSSVGVGISDEFRREQLRRAVDAYHRPDLPLRFRADYRGVTKNCLILAVLAILTSLVLR